MARPCGRPQSALKARDGGAGPPSRRRLIPQTRLRPTPTRKADVQSPSSRQGHTQRCHARSGTPTEPCPVSVLVKNRLILPHSNLSAFFVCSRAHMPPISQHGTHTFTPLNGFAFPHKNLHPAPSAPVPRTPPPPALAAPLTPHTSHGLASSGPPPRPARRHLPQQLLPLRRRPVPRHVLRHAAPPQLVQRARRAVHRTRPPHRPH